LFGRVRGLPEDVKARLRRLFTELAILLLKTVNETSIQKLLCAATLTRDGSKLEISPMVELFNFKIYKYGPYDHDISRHLRDITDVKVHACDEDVVTLRLEHDRFSRSDIVKKIVALCDEYGISEVCEDYVRRLHNLAKIYGLEIRDLVYDLLNLDDDKKVLLLDMSLRDVLKLLGLYPEMSYEDALRDVLGDELYSEVRKIQEDVRRLGIRREEPLGRGRWSVS